MILRITILVVALIAISTNEVNAIAGPGVGTAMPGDYPSTVVIGNPTTTPPNNLLCHGVVLNNNHILTAATCVLDEHNSLVPFNTRNVRAGTINIAIGTPIVAQRIFVHPLYNPHNFENNLAVIRLNANLAFDQNLPNQSILPADRNDRIVGDAAQCVVPGFNAAGTLVSLATQVINRDVCGAQAVEHMCASSSLPGTNGVCERNRGTGLFCNGRLTGILSNGFSCGLAPIIHGVYVQTRFYETWIQQQLTRQDTPAPGATPAPGFPTLAPGTTPDGSSSLTGSIFLAIVASILVLFNNQ